MQTESNTTQAQDHFDLSKILTGFFKLQDWQKRSLYIGFPFSASLTLFVVSLGGFVLVIMKDGVLPAELGITAFLVYLFSIPVLLVTSLSAGGYKIKQAEASRDRTETHGLYSMMGFLSRIKHALILAVLSLVYQAIPIGIVMFGYFIFFVSAFLSANTDAFVILTILGYILLLGGGALQTVIEFLLYPLVTARYINNPSFMNVANYMKTWNSFRQQLRYVFLTALVIYLLQSVVLSTIYGGLIVFLVAGAILTQLYLAFAVLAILIFVPLFAITTTYFQHVQGEMIGNLARIIRSNHE